MFQAFSSYDQHAGKYLLLFLACIVRLKSNQHLYCQLRCKLSPVFSSPIPSQHSQLSSRHLKSAQCSLSPLHQTSSHTAYHLHVQQYLQHFVSIAISLIKKVQCADLNGINLPTRNTGTERSKRKIPMIAVHWNRKGRNRTCDLTFAVRSNH